MALRWFIRPNSYYDSVRLMRVSEMLSQQPGISRAAAVMATPLNIDLLRDDGLLPAEIQSSSEDLVVSILGIDDHSADEALAQVDAILAARSSPESLKFAGVPFTTLEQASPGHDLAVIAVPGAYAATEAFLALRRGLHVFLFSDNVPLEDEVSLKDFAVRSGLLMMGPDCGTAIIGGIGLGFANRVQPGPVGIVGASGTGIQHLCCLLDAAGIGIAAAIGTGGRDLSQAVDGRMTFAAVRALDADPNVEVIAVVSKPADANVGKRMHQELCVQSKPVVACLQGSSFEDVGSVRYAADLTEQSRIICNTLRRDPPVDSAAPDRIRTNNGRVYGLYTGGTLCSEAARILDSMGAPHHLLDLGDDEYTRGRAHPIIDPRLRNMKLSEMVDKHDVGAILLDIVLGDLAHPDPASMVVPVLDALRSTTLGDPIQVIAVVIGTRDDPQNLVQQCAILNDAGVQVMTSNSAAAHQAGSVVGGTA